MSNHATRLEFTRYDALGVSETATADDIKAAWQRLVKRYHPDRQSPTDSGWVDPWPHRVFLYVQDAYAVLSDPATRAEYDAHLAQMRQQRQRKAAPAKQTEHPAAADPPKKRNKPLVPKPMADALLEIGEAALQAGVDKTIDVVLRKIRWPPNPSSPKNATP